MSIYIKKVIDDMIRVPLGRFQFVDDKHLSMHYASHIKKKDLTREEYLKQFLLNRTKTLLIYGKHEELILKKERHLNMTKIDWEKRLIK